MKNQASMIAIVFLSFFCVPAAFAQQMPAMQFLLLQQDFRASGMGGAYTALSDDPGAPFANPAGMASLKNTYISAGLNTANGLSGASAGGTPGTTQAAFIHPTSNWGTWGLNATVLSIKSNAYDSSGNPLGASSDNNLAGGFSYAAHLTKNLSFGFMSQYARESLNPGGSNMNAAQANAYMATIGMIYASDSDRWRYGVVGYNLGPGVSWGNTGGSYGGSGGSSPLPGGVRVGIAHRFLESKSLSADVDYDIPLYAIANSVHAGLEWQVDRYIALRGGIMAGNQMTAPTAGIGLSVGGLMFDFAFNDDMQLGPGLGVNVAWRFARSSPKAATPALPVAAAPISAPLPTAAAGVQKPRTSSQELNMAVMSLTPQNCSQTDADAATEFLTSAVANLGRFNVLERGDIKRIFAEQKFQQSGCTKKECVAKIGQILNAQKLVVGTLTKLEGTYIINARVVDVQSGVIDVAVPMNAGTSPDSMMAAAQQIAKKIADFYK